MKYENAYSTHSRLQSTKYDTELKDKVPRMQPPKNVSNLFCVEALLSEAFKMLINNNYNILYF